jgi:isoprenylcysteine carboxyl methyltransferase (ICMT) family protein YpbQ
MFPLALLLIAFVPMLLEAWLSSNHERALRAVGAVEPADDVYPVMQVTYPACFVAMVIEAWWRQSGVNQIALGGGLLFAGAKALKYWAIATLGSRWTFRVLVPPGSMRTLSGPYRFMRHPNYLGVMGELAGFAILAQAPVAGALSVIAFAFIIIARIRVEDRALGLRSG